MYNDVKPQQYLRRNLRLLSKRVEQNARNTLTGNSLRRQGGKTAKVQTVSKHSYKGKKGRGNKFARGGVPYSHVYLAIMQGSEFPTNSMRSMQCITCGCVLRKKPPRRAPMCDLAVGKVENGYVRGVQNCTPHLLFLFSKRRKRTKK